MGKICIYLAEQPNEKGQVFCKKNLWKCKSFAFTTDTLTVI